MEPFDPLTAPQKLADTMECSMVFSCPTAPSYPTSYSTTNSFPMSYVPQGPVATPVAPAQAPAPSGSNSLTDLQDMPNNYQHIRWEDIPQQQPFSSTSTAIGNGLVTNVTNTETSEQEPSNERDDNSVAEDEDALENLGDTPNVSPESYYDSQVSPMQSNPGAEKMEETRETEQEPEIKEETHMTEVQKMLRGVLNKAIEQATAEEPIKIEEESTLTTTNKIVREVAVRAIGKDTEKDPILVEGEEAKETEETEETTSEGSISGGSVSEPSPTQRPEEEEEEEENDYLDISEELWEPSPSPDYSDNEELMSPRSPSASPPPLPQYTPTPKPLNKNPRDPRSTVSRLAAGQSITLCLPQLAPARETR